MSKNQHTDLSEPIWGTAADELGARLRERLADRDTEASRAAYADWRQHIDGCTACGDALAPCTVEPQLWRTYRELAS